LADYLPISPENVERIGAKGDTVLKQTVGEENLGYLFFGNKYNILILFAIAGFFLVPYLVFRRQNDFYSFIFFFWLVVTFVMAFNKLKFTYTLGLPIAACGGIFFHQTFEFMKGRVGFEKKFIALILGFLLLCGVGIGSFFVTQQTPSIEGEPQWQEAFAWIKENTSTDAKMFNWWDYGHWMAFMAERGVSNENRNYRTTEYNAHTAQFFLSETEEEALALVNEYGSDYVVFDTGVLMRHTSFAIFAFNTIDRRDPRLNRYFGNIINCYQRITPLTGEVSYICGGDMFSEQDLAALPTTWTNTPTQIYEGRLPLFIYRAQDNSKLYVLNGASNKTIPAKLIFNDPSITHFKEVFNNEFVRIYQVT
jgi:dolichyl-diphosphooligosaccharide--protein glycosyltransferase